MNHDPVFRFSGHFDDEYLQELYENNIEYVIDLFETFCDIITGKLQNIEAHLESAEWEHASFSLNRFRENLYMVGLTSSGQEMRHIEQQVFALTHQPRKEIIDTASIVMAFRRIHIEVLAHLPYFREEIARMKVYLSHPQRQG
ncbi:hypothetical protein [Chitinophaga varians]|uniref:hypothetical protein n=1 Tax=Chitinophaga varians TaxID=2202339 RepID=UPI00165FC41A|nr:hypothetical protein [Chitinophaga varians]MBC9909574.1 hypothetical protein [Chitinophaga varians]